MTVMLVMPEIIFLCWMDLPTEPLEGVLLLAVIWLPGNHLEVVFRGKKCHVACWQGDGAGEMIARR